jgi:hypothetical protein
MFRGSARVPGWRLAAAIFCSLGPALLQAWPAAQHGPSGSSPPALNWQSAARLHRGLTPEPGTLAFDGNGIEFRSKRFSRRWPYAEVKSFDLMARRLILTDYENRSHHWPGERRFRFELASPVPAEVAAELARAVVKPVRNRDTDPRAPCIFTIAARHGTRFGGSNGTLRFREEGIDYTTSTGSDNRSWRWADIQTLACPDPYHLRIGAYREIFNFDLKRALRAEEFDRLWDKLYASDLKGLQTGERAGDDIEGGTN